MPQTSIPDSPAKGYAGLLEPGAPFYRRSARTEGAGLSAGQVVKRGTNPEKQVAAYAGSDEPSVADIAGVLVLDPTRSFEDSGGTAGLAAGSGCAVLRMGTVLLAFAAAVTAGQRVYLDVSTGELFGEDDGETLGAGDFYVPGMRIAETIGAAGLASVEVNLLGH